MCYTHTATIDRYSFFCIELPQTLMYSRKTLSAARLVPNHWLHFLTQAWDERKGVRPCRRVGRCGNGERERARPIEGRVFSGVKGQPPESVNAATVGTDQSQRRSRIDQNVGTHLDTH